MSVFGSMNISATGMTAQQLRVDVVSQNIANVNSTRDANGNVYKRKTVVFQEKNITPFADALNAASSAAIGDGVKVMAVVEDTETPSKLVYDPSNPDANEEGYVEYPNVDVVTEMTNMIDASRSYEANATAFDASKNMILKALEMGQ